MFQEERCKAALRELQRQFVSQVTQAYEAAGLNFSVAALGLQKAGINPKQHWPDENTGWWLNEGFSSGKPARWLLNAQMGEGKLRVTLAEGVGPDGNIVRRRRADCIASLNSSSRDPSAGVCTPVWLALRQTPDSYVVPEDWGWLLAVGFEQGIITASANQVLRYDMDANTISTLGKSPVTVQVSVKHLLHLPDINSSYKCDGSNVTYEDATRALHRFLGTSMPEPKQ
ncbi:hypothetical protein [Paraburkholderia sp. C35]|uniref:hypothetical protein n=1 Tax=Paraburkholderia sp. C35 TaxID=2126993 RepID=UPI000D6932A1|nr:hypothetical protein [Paraburkholderia sp. C35]